MYEIKEDIMGYCDCCASNQDKPQGPTITYIIPVIGSKSIIVSLCEIHLVEGAELLQSIKSNHEGD